MPNLGASTEDFERLQPPAVHDEVELVRRAQLGSSGAFEQLVLARGPDLYRYLASRLRNESDARDALQETFVAAWQGLAGLRRRERFWPWLVGIATHKATDIGRRRERTKEHAVEALSGEDVTATELLDVLDSLPRAHREMLLVRYVLELTEEEAAEALGIRVGTVKSRSARARQALMELLR